MDVKSVLKTIYINKLLRNNLDNIKDINLINSKYFSNNILTPLGRSQINVVLAGGVFDIIHPGHIHTLNTAKELGDILVVVVATDKITFKMKKKKPLHTQIQRQQLVNSLSMVDVCLKGNEDNIFETVKLVQPQYIVLGYDQIHQEEFINNGCKKINLDCKIIRSTSPIPDTSSSNIYKSYGDSIHGI